MNILHPIRFLSAFVFLLQPFFSLTLQLHAGVQLSESSFDELTASGLWFIENYSPFCPHCKRFAPKWVELVETMKPYESKGLKLGQVDCIAQGDLCIKLQVDFYPQMKLFEDGKYIEHYTGDKTVEAIKSYLELKVEAYKLKHKPASPFESEPQVLEPEASQSTVDELSADSPLATDHSAHHSNPSSENTPTGHAANSHNPNSQTNAPNQDGRLIQLFPSNWAEYTHLHHSGHPLLVYYHTSWCKECRTLTPVLVETADQLKNEVNVAEFDCDRKQANRICKDEGLSEFPVFILYHQGTKLSHYGNNTAGALVEFARQVSSTIGAHEINAQEFDKALLAYPVFFLFLHSSNTPITVINAVESVGKSFSGTAIILKSDQSEVFDKLSLTRGHAYLLVFKEHDPSPWAKISVQDSSGRGEPSATKRMHKLALAIRHWVAINSVPLMEELSNRNFYRVLSSGSKKLVVMACLSGMVTDADGVLDLVKSNPKSIQLMEDMKVWAHQWRKSQAARGVNDIMIDWVWLNAEQWDGWLYNAYKVNLPKPRDDPRESSAIIITDAWSHMYYDLQENGIEIQFKPSSVFQALLGVEMKKLRGKLSGTRWGRLKWRMHQFRMATKFMFQPSWMIFWVVLVAVVWFSVKFFKSSGSLFGPQFASSPSAKIGFPPSGAYNDSSHCKPGLGQVFGLGSNLPFKAD